MADNKALTTRAADFSAWYNELIMKAELEYDQFKTLPAGGARLVDADFERAARALPILPRTKRPKKDRQP